MGSCSLVWQSAIGLGDLVVKVFQELLYGLGFRVSGVGFRV